MKNPVKKCKTCKQEFVRQNQAQVNCPECIAKRKPKMTRQEYLLKLARRTEDIKRYKEKQMAQKPANYYTCEKCGSTDMKSDGDARYCRKCFWHPKIYLGRPTSVKQVPKRPFELKDYDCMNCGTPVKAKTSRTLCPECRKNREEDRQKKRCRLKKFTNWTMNT